MMKKWWWTIFIGIILLNFSYANVFINEIELNPSGADAGNEFIELYNGGSLVNISNWYFQDKDGNNYSLPSEIVGNDNFFVLENISGLDDLNQKIILYNQFGTLKDQTIFLNDSSDNSETWQRLLDGSSNFVFKEETKGFPNELTNISNKSYTPTCLIKDDKLELSAKVDGFCIDQVIFSVLANNSWKNFSGNLVGNKYRVEINSSIEDILGNTNWTVYSIDCFNRTVQDGIESFYINNPTTLSINPINPDGLSGWYISQPLFTLVNPDASALFYKWNGEAIINYSSPFRLEDAPNNGNITGGIHKLSYFSNISCKKENERSKIFKFDFTSPFITDLEPANNSIVYFNPRPTIQALLDEVYQSNSGIKTELVSMTLDGSVVPINVIPSGSLDAIVRHNPTSNLIEGQHNVTVNATDKAGRYSQTSWSFIINFTDGLNMSIYAPQNGSYNTKRIPFNITLTKKAELKYINQNDKTPKLKRLCRNCDEYGFKRPNTQTLNDGWNNITIFATDEFGNVREANLGIFIDSKPPKISTIMPRRNSVTNGSDFSIKYSEENPVNITLIFNPNITFQNCSSGTNVNCSQFVNLSDFNGKYIDFKFFLNDGINSIESKETRVFVDTVPPNISVNSPINVSYNNTKIPFNISSSESVRIEYFDDFDPSPRWKSLCSRCSSYGFDIEKVKRLKLGSHDITFKAVDSAGNTDEETIKFNIV